MPQETKELTLNAVRRVESWFRELLVKVSDETLKGKLIEESDRGFLPKPPGEISSSGGKEGRPVNSLGSEHRVPSPWSSAIRFARSKTRRLADSSRRRSAGIGSEQRRIEEPQVMFALEGLEVV